MQDYSLLLNIQQKKRVDLKKLLLLLFLFFYSARNTATRIIGNFFGGHKTLNYIVIYNTVNLLWFFSVATFLFVEFLN